MILRLSTRFPSHRRYIILALAALLSSAALAFGSPGPQSQSVERKLRVKAETASVRLKPDPASPVAAVLKRGALLTSYEMEGSWYRVVPDAGPDAVRVVGYIAAADVDVLEEKTRTTGDFWSETESAFADLAWEATLTGGFVTFAGGDFAAGTRGLYDGQKAALAAYGYELGEEEVHPFRSGFGGTLELEKRLSPRLALGLALVYGLAQKFDTIWFHNEMGTRTANSTPVLRTMAIRAGLRYTVPLGSVLSASFMAGPVFHFAGFEYNRLAKYGYSPVSQTETFRSSYHIKVWKAFPGAYAGAELGVRLAHRTEIVLRAVYQLARASGWEGKEKLDLWQYPLGDVSPPEVEGTLYALTENGFPTLGVRAAPPGAGAAEAVLDFSGLSLSAGLRIRF